MLDKYIIHAILYLSLGFGKSASGWVPLKGGHEDYPHMRAHTAHIEILSEVLAKDQK